MDILTNMKNYFLIAAAFFASACQEKSVPGTIELLSDEIYISDNGSPVEVRLTSTAPWRLEYNLENGWLSTDLMGGRASTDRFRVSARVNTSESLRLLKIRVQTVDGADSKELTVIQLSSYPSIVPESCSLVVPAADASYRISLTANVEDDAITFSCDAGWLEDIRIEEGMLCFSTQENVGTSGRGAVIQLESADSYGRTGEAVIRVLQSAPSRYKDAPLTGFATASALPSGPVTENACVEGYVAVNGTSANYDANRYVLVDSEGHSLVFESDDLIAMSVGCKARIALTDMVAEEFSEGSYSYKVFTGMNTEHLIRTDGSDYSVPDVTIGQVDDSRLFNVVTLKDVEVALPAGAFTNFKTCWPGNEAQKQYNYFVLSHPFYYRYYPVPLRDRNGDSIYMLTTLDAPWAHRTLPSGSGSVTGLIVRVKIRCFDIKEDIRCIIPLSDSDIRLDETVNDVSVVLAEWDCNAKLTDPSKPGSAIIAMDKYNPDGGLLKGNESVILNKSGNTKFSRTYNDYVLGYQDSFRGDANLSDVDDGWYGTLSGGWYGRVNGGAFNSRPWNSTQFFYIDGISTKDITGSLSLQLSMNVTNGRTTFVIEYADALSAGNWTQVPESQFDVYGQLDRSDTARQTESNFPGYKFFTFALPDDLLGRDNVCIRIRAVSASSWQPVRLDHLSLKYNK